jgi:hypothetical protein
MMESMADIMGSVMRYRSWELNPASSTGRLCEILPTRLCLNYTSHRLPATLFSLSASPQLPIP